MLLNVWSLFVLPDEVAIHFGRGGKADGWASREFHVILLSVFQTILFVVFYFMPRIINKIPARYINLPNRDYWLSDKNRETALRKLENTMFEFGTALLAFFLFVTYLTIQANLSHPVRLNEDLFFPVFILFMLYTVLWTIRVIVSFRKPKQQ
jgi:hypothetical protein